MKIPEQITGCGISEEMDPCQGYAAITDYYQGEPTGPLPGSCRMPSWATPSGWMPRINSTGSNCNAPL